MTDQEIRVIALDPAIWIRGEGSVGSYLLHPENGRMCCVGIACVSYGVPPKEFLGEGELNGLYESVLPAPLNFVRLTGGDLELYDINDAPGRVDADRVAALNDILARHEASFRFTLLAERET